ncbi:hypothetical protein D3C73_1331140 [compost metagenome]
MIQCYNIPPLRNGDNQLAGLLGDTFCRPVADTRFNRRDGRVRDELSVGVQNPLEILAQNNGSIHFSQLIQIVRREIAVDGEPSIHHFHHLGAVAYDNQRARLGPQHIFQSITERCARSRKPEQVIHIFRLLVLHLSAP